MSLGKLLKELLGDEGLRDAAKRMDITYSYLAMLERGKDRRTGNLPKLHQKLCNKSLTPINMIIIS
ncbi:MULTISPECIES: hypothetical protein [Lysinibacillus]|uniref:XRE family transcriptional regulator n=1 Tax=Lysinibacillus fusiformis TaxID=28031 RepID=A0A2I0UYV2_9BACI|nr:MULTISPECIES: hypothetical protein [Lysinibacillus]PKU51248.1 hypothetical protein CRI88_10990 [Lysinibacillus fusiformis]SCY07782.1 hypothetical protein SAMN02787078_00730 [Lysinibacillus sp. SG9]SDB13559.1 hypothetical protein SAMN02787079_01042 [Lysinibacillus sp. TC-37]SFS52027.1 hypothetical protein SAMN02787087_01045 [Lysinibacillus sp. SG55]